MAVLIPPYITSNKNLYGEKRVFKLLQESNLSNKVTIFHSLNLFEHKTKREGETDFLVLSPEGILVLEVKGSKSIKYEDGIWYYLTNAKSYSTKESPFNQAKKNMYSIVDSLNKHVSVGINYKKMSGYGVIFSNLIFDEKSIEWSKNIILDENNLDEIDSFIMGLFQYWRNKSNISSKFKLSLENLTNIKQYLRPNFEKFENVRSLVDGTNEKIDKATEEQYEILDALESNERILVNGLAGTGKTFLAIEQAKRQAYNNKKVLLLCFNKILYQNTYSQLRKYENIYVYNIDKLLIKTLKENKLYEKIKDIDFLKGKLNENINNIEIQKFDYLVIDEGQDILNRKYFYFIDKLLINGIENGMWSIFYDDKVQDEFFTDNNQLQNFIQELKKGAVNYKLTVNCRNVEYIGKKTYSYTTLPVPSRYKVKCDWNNIFIEYTSNSLASKLSNILIKLLKDGVMPHKITILSPIKKFEVLKEVYPSVKSYIRTFINLSEFSTDIVKEGDIKIDTKSISYSTIQSFKGLENDIIIIMNVKSLVSELEKALLYVGMTRTKSILYLIADESLKQIIK